MRALTMRNVIRAWGTLSAAESVHLLPSSACTPRWTVVQTSLICEVCSAALWRAGGLVVGAVIEPNLGLLPEALGEVCYAFWQGGPSLQPGFLPDERMQSRSGEGYARLRRGAGAWDFPC
jgi:hypothetical protein